MTEQQLLSEHEAIPERKATPASRIPELDGLRGIAVLLVVCSHLLTFPHETSARSWADRIVGLAGELGWLGVDLFFVLSGFLITGILSSSKGSPGYFRNFYGRRVLRIFPIYYAFLFLTFHVFPHLHWLGTEFGIPADLRKWQWWLYVGNCPAAFGAPTTSVLMPAWSLCIEEQFYVVWPFVVLLCSRRQALLCSGLLVGCAVAFRAVAVARHWPGGVPYFFTASRVDGLAIGGALALAFESQRGSRVATTLAKWCGWLPAMGIAALVVTAQRRHLDVRQYPLGNVLVYSLAAMAFASVLAIAVSARPAPLRAMPLRFLGKYSFCIYLFHEVFHRALEPHLVRVTSIHLYSSGFPGVTLAAIIIGAATTAFAILSWNVYEKNWLRLKRFFPDSGRRELVDVLATAA